MNSKKTLPWLILFWLACIVNLIGHLFEIELLSIVSKPGLMILVGIYFYNSVEKNTRSKFIRTTLFALLFSWLGDVLLIFENLFLFGLAAFLIAHLFYAFTYSNAVVKVMDNRVTFVRRLFWSIALILFGIAFLYLMEPNLQEMFIPVVIYSMVIVFMGVMAVQRNGRTSIASYGLTLLGALLFCATFIQNILVNLWMRKIPIFTWSNRLCWY